jgi:RNA polymerase sigma-70 factor (ECF subfamily)
LPTDDELLSRVQKRSKPAFNELFSRHEPSVRRRLRTVLRDPDAAKDVLQEVFVRVWEKASAWDGRGTARGWIYRITLNLAFNYLRDRRRLSELPLDARVPAEADDDADSQLPRFLESGFPEPPAAFETAETRGYVQELIDGLPAPKRAVMHMVHCEDFSVREVSEALGIPDGTVKSRLFYGRKAIEGRLKSFLEE